MERPNAGKFIEYFATFHGFAQKTQGASVARIVSRAKAQRRKENLRNAAALCAFCARNILGKNTFCVNHVS